MGCCCGCMRKAKYERIDEPDLSDGLKATNEKGESNGSQYQAKTAGKPHIDGSEVMQKFSNSSTYNRRFIWIEVPSKTMHLSEHMNKNRRHKEASLANITTVIKGPPLKKKKKSSQSEGDDYANCLTINFKRGGGVDVQFQSSKERDAWFDALNDIMQEFGASNSTK